MVSVPRVRLIYCNPPQKHIVAGGRAEEGALYCVTVRDVSRSREDPSIVTFSVEPDDR